MRNPQVTIDGTPISVYRFIVDADNRYERHRHKGEFAQRLLATGRAWGFLPEDSPGSQWKKINDFEVEFYVVVGIDVTLTIETIGPHNPIGRDRLYTIDWAENPLGPLECALQKSSFGFEQTNTVANYTLTAFVEV